MNTPIDAQLQATLDGINNAEQGTPDDYKERALTFLYQYAEQHQFFHGGEVLAAWRKTDDDIAKQDWRNRWGAIMSAGRRAGYIAKAGKVKPKTVQSHTGVLTNWESQVFAGQKKEIITANDKIIALRKSFMLHEKDLLSVLWEAYEMGINE